MRGAHSVPRLRCRGARRHESPSGNSGSGFTRLRYGVLRVATSVCSIFLNPRWPAVYNVFELDGLPFRRLLDFGGYKRAIRAIGDPFAAAIRTPLLGRHSRSALAINPAQDRAHRDTSGNRWS